MILHGDCRELIKNVADNSIDLVCTDPPYLINYKTNHRKDRTHDFCTEIANDGIEDATLLADMCKEYARVLKDNTALYFFTSPKTIDIVKPIIEEHFAFKNIIAWVKNNWTAGDLKGQYGQQYEMIVYAVKGHPPIRGKRIPDVWEFPRVSGDNQVHQNQKPVDLLKQIIMKSSDVGNTVLDTFAGSCSLAEAAIKTGRKFICFEYNKDYVALAKKRLNLVAYNKPFWV